MKNKVIKVFVLILLFIVCSFSVTRYVKADSGWDSGYDSGGSWDSGG